MKNIFIAILIAVSGSIAHADCYTGAYKFAQMINNMHKLGWNRNRIESTLRSQGMQAEVINVGNRYSSLLFRNEPRGGWAQGEYELFASSFAKGACSK